MAWYDLDSVIQQTLLREVSLYGVARVPFFFGSENSTGVRITELTESKRPKIDWGNLRNMLRLKVNPQSLRITPYIRTPEAKTGGGRVYYHWLDEEDRSVEVYTLEMRGVTGNLFPGTTGSREKLYLWMKLRELTMEPFWIEEKETGRRISNKAFILIKTVGLPVAVLFVGFFRRPMMLEESSANQYNIPWNFEFIIEKMYPDYSVMSTYVSTLFIAPEIIDRVLGD